jgi:hypothetical protein
MDVWKLNIIEEIQMKILKINLFIMNELLLSIGGTKIYENATFGLLEKTTKVWYKILL